MTHPARRTQEGWSHPKDPAPGALNVVQMFVNSDDMEEGTDEFGSVEQTAAWLFAAGLLGEHEAVTEADRAQAVAVRGALRELLLANHERVPPDVAEARAVLDAAAADAQFELRFTGAGESQLVPTAPGVAGAIGRVLAIVFDAMHDGTWARMKACRNDLCLWAFYDHSRNRSGAWCSMETCGAQMKMRAYRKRHAAARS
jgi:predicted RNA-binding Zn ribbon-like protein